MASSQYDPGCLPDYLPIYYKKLFPFGPYYRWLSYGGVPEHYFAKREFSFTLKDDIYVRYQSFEDQNSLEKEIQRRCPYKIDIGAVFSHRPKDHKTITSTAFQAQEKELVFDIDMTDYDDVRACCSGAAICEKCWPLMTIAVKIIDRALRDDFGFEHLLWVYSGRRGIHCWVCDQNARKLSEHARSAIAEYLTVVKGGENTVKKIKLDFDKVHVSITLALEIVQQHFEDYAVKKQDFIGSEDQLEKVLVLIPNQELQEGIRSNIQKLAAGKLQAGATDNSHNRWKLIKSIVQDSMNKTEFLQSYKCIEEIMLQYCYPRLDVNVSKGVNHLLKSPFCIHPKTGRVCVPIDVDNLEEFDPTKVPTLSQLCDELNSMDTKSDDDVKRKIHAYKRTSMKDSIRVFEDFVQKLEKTWSGKKIEQSDAMIEF